jgi:DNA ligase-4
LILGQYDFLDLIISVKETTVFSVFHEDAMALFNTCSDLKRVSYELSDPNKRLDAEDKTVKLFRAFAPMLCKRPTKHIDDTVKLMGGEKFIIEEKLDGERMQLHKQGNEYFYCSRSFKLLVLVLLTYSFARKGKDYTYLYGRTIGEGSLTPYIGKAFDPRVTRLLLSLSCQHIYADTYVVV